MENPILKDLTTNRETNQNQNSNPLQALTKSNGNPNEFMKQYVMNNPNFKMVMNYVQQNGNDPKTAFYNLAKMRGIDPDQFLSNLKGVNHG